MAEESLLLYKLMILYMLDQLEFPLSTASFTEFFVTRGYTSYFHMQQALHELVEAEYIIDKHVRNSTNYTLSQTGKEALALFEYKISDMTKQDIMEYFKENKMELRRSVEITAEYFPTPQEEYMVNAKIREKGVILLELNINVVSKDQAIAICDNWEKNSDSVYENIIEMLLL